MRIRQFRYGLDNFGYLLYGDSQAVAIDAGGSPAVVPFLNKEGLRLKYIVHTHGHQDHTTGSSILRDQTGAVILSNDYLRGQGGILIDGEEIEIFHAPGHTRDSLLFYARPFLVTGDTLFNGTIGNCYSNDLKAFYRSLEKIRGFPEDTLIFAGHDYVHEAMLFAKRLEPANREIDRFLAGYHPRDVKSLLRDELLINPYLRTDEEPIVEFLKQKGLPVDTRYRRWESLMSVE